MIVSDTHRRHGNLMEAIDREGVIDKLIHLGDFEGEEDIISSMVKCEVVFVPGNNDFFAPYDREVELMLGKYKVLLTHGHYYYVSLDLQTLREEGIARGMDIVMFGHTHRPVISIEDNITLINPGSISYPRQSDHKPTYIMMEINDKDEIKYTLKTI
jgi:putative phosphoesterase